MYSCFIDKFYNHFFLCWCAGAVKSEDTVEKFKIFIYTSFNLKIKSFGNMQKKICKFFTLYKESRLVYFFRFNIRSQTLIQ